MQIFFSLRRKVIAFPNASEKFLVANAAVEDKREPAFLVHVPAGKIVFAREDFLGITVLLSISFQLFHGCSCSRAVNIRFHSEI